MIVEPPSFGAYLRHLRRNRRDEQPVSRTQLAAQAGTSVGYLTKLEQGTAHNPSTDIVDSLADALDAKAMQRRHLHDLVAYHHHADPDRIERRPEISDLMRQYVDNLVPNIAGFVDDAWNVLYANSEYARIYRHIDNPGVGNVLRWFFHVRESRAIMIEWETEARLTVAWCRALMVRRPGSTLFTPLLNDLARSADFVRMWNMQEIFMGRRTPYMRVHDLDRDQDLQLIAQVYPWPDPATAIQLYLGVRTDCAANHDHGVAGS